MKKEVKAYLSSLGKKGGSSKSDKKVKASRENMMKAIEKRWPKTKEEKCLEV